MITDADVDSIGEPSRIFDPSSPTYIGDAPANHLDVERWAKRCEADDQAVGEKRRRRTSVARPVATTQRGA
jgi:hypothetical protein